MVNILGVIPARLESTRLPRKVLREIAGVPMVVYVFRRAQGCRLNLAGAGGLTVEARVEVPADAAAGWRYADPRGGDHDVVNCSVATLELTVTQPGGAAARELRTAHGCAYELGMREHDHGVAIAPFTDG